jgi:hypothetical protein
VRRILGTYLLRHSEVAPGGVKKWEAEGERGVMPAKKHR